VLDINPGDWEVHAVAEPAGDTGRSPALRATTERVTTRLAPLVRAPGVRPFAWPILVLSGVVLALVLQNLLLERSGSAGAWSLATSLAAVVMGYLTAKVWYLVLHRQHLRAFVAAGTCIQGFITGTFITASLLLVAQGRAFGPFLDATTPGLFFAMGVARPGCFLGGCCAGRPTTSRWGLWSSDRRLGTRRLPTQLWEGLAAMLIGAGSLILVLDERTHAGFVFVGALGAYTLVRQGLFSLRVEPRRVPHARALAATAGGIALGLSLALTLAR
jgi:phosphatidylglycerol:prolipoprotein diacylglycerol transferase